MPILKRIVNQSAGSRRSGPGVGISVTSSPNLLHFLTTGEGSTYVDAETALKNSDIYSIVYQLSSDLANGKLYSPQARTEGILTNPAATSNAHSFWQSLYMQLLLGGEAFAYRWRNQNGTDKYLEYLRPSQVSTYKYQDGSGLYYSVNFDEPQIGTMDVVPSSDMIHIRLGSQNGGMTGVSPLQALSSELQIKDKSDKLTLSALGRSIMAPGILKIQHGGLLSDKKRASRSRRFMQQTAHSNNGPIVLDDGEDYQPLEIKSNVAQLLSQVNWTSAQIAKVYGVSDAMLNGTGDAQSSIEMISRQYIRSLNRFASSIESELTNKLNGDVKLDLRPAVDPLMDELAGKVDQLRKDGTLAQNQAQYVLQKLGYLPEGLPKAEPSVDAKTSAEGGVNGNEDSKN